MKEENAMIGEGLLGTEISEEEAIKQPEGTVCLINVEGGDNKPKSQYVSRLIGATSSEQRCHFVKAGLPGVGQEGTEIFALTKDEVLSVAHQALSMIQKVRQEVF